MELLILAGLAFAIYAVSWIAGKCHKASLYDDLKPRLDSLDEFEHELDERSTKQDKRDLQLDKKHEAILLLAKQKAIGFPWLAEAYADFFQLEELQVARALETKPRPALKGAEEVRKAGQRRREAEKKARLLEYQIKYYENLFPWLVDLKSEDVEDELIRISSGTSENDESYDAAQRWLTPEEYKQLPSSKKYELALERYWTKKKSKWEIGRDYERYTGYLYEKNGNAVRYQGIIEGFDDLGRDLIVKRSSATLIVQCKNWSRDKVIHEKHIFQLYGTYIAYKFDHPDEKVSAAFVTSTNLSDRARSFAKFLGIKVSEKLPLVRYPCIKCHVSKKTGEKIYHLPFDQQYDRTIIETDKGEYFVTTVKEAEAMGFRRAFRYQGPKEA